jgi:hypothetical protein
LRFSFNSKLANSVLPVLAVSELTREVCLGDQSGRIVGAKRNSRKRYFAEILWIFVHGCARNFLKTVRAFGVALGTANETSTAHQQYGDREFARPLGKYELL